MQITYVKYLFVFLILVTPTFAEDLSEKNPENATSVTETEENWVSRMNGANVIYHGTKQYHIFSSFALNWFEASAFCIFNKMSLASPSTYETNRLLVQALRSMNLVYTYKRDYWISASDIGDSKTWIWMSTGRPVTYTDWLPGEPNHAYKTYEQEREHCVEIEYKKGKGGWNDFICSYRQFFICEK